MKLILQSIYFNRPKKEIFDFFEKVSQLDIDEYHIRDISCEKRDYLSVQDYKKIISILRKNNKTIIMSTFPFQTSRDTKLAKLAKLVDYIEINNIGILNIIKNKEKIILGPYLKIYTKQDLDFFSDYNIERMVIPYNLDDGEIENLINRVKIKKELFIFGKIPVNLSWNCFIAMQKNKNRKNCNMDCFAYSNGIDVESLEKQPLFTIIGIEVLSNEFYKTNYNINSLDVLKKFEYLRINPNFVENIDGLCKKIKNKNNFS